MPLTDNHRQLIKLLAAFAVQEYLEEINTIITPVLNNKKSG
jgi:hypothetical protein